MTTSVNKANDDYELDDNNELGDDGRRKLNLMRWHFLLVKYPIKANWMVGMLHDCGIQLSAAGRGLSTLQSLSSAHMKINGRSSL